MTSSTYLNIELEELGRNELFFAYGKDSSNSALDQLKYVMMHMRSQELKNSWTYNGTSPQRHLRLEIIEWLKEVAEKLKVKRKSLFHGVSLYDRFSEAHDISPRQIFLVGLICLHLAVKFDQTEHKILKMRTIKKNLPENADYSDVLFRKMEKYILNHFEWNIMMTTVIDFAEFFLLFAVESGDIHLDECNNRIQNSSLEIFKADENTRRERGEINTPVTMADVENDTDNNIISNTDRNDKIILQCTLKLAEKMKALLDDILIAQPSNEYLPSLLAASVVMFGRKATGLMPWWTEKLKSVTQYEEAEVGKCLNDYISGISSLDVNSSSCDSENDNHTLQIKLSEALDVTENNSENMIIEFETDSDHTDHNCDTRSHAVQWYVLETSEDDTILIPGDGVDQETVISIKTKTRNEHDATL